AGFAKYGLTTGLGEVALSLHAYHATWNPTEQIPERAIGSAVCPDLFCSPDPTARGRTTRFVAAATLDGPDWQGALGAQFYDWRMT
ncbi:hypothetical protein ABTE40_20985, partial [Acinetobacter baumannii]